MSLGLVSCTIFPMGLLLCSWPTLPGQTDLTQLLLFIKDRLGIWLCNPVEISFPLAVPLVGLNTVIDEKMQARMHNAMATPNCNHILAIGVSGHHCLILAVLLSSTGYLPSCSIIDMSHGKLIRAPCPSLADKICFQYKHDRVVISLCNNLYKC